MPSDKKTVKVDIPEAALLADLYGILHDLDTAKEWCTKVTKNSRTTSWDMWSDEAITTGAIIKYFRCFTTGVRFGLRRDDIANIGDKLLKKHDYHKSLRDKFIAHPVNPFDESYVNVSITVNDGELSLSPKLYAGHTQLLLSHHEATELLELIMAVKNCVTKIIADEEKKLHEVISKLPSDIWNEWDTHIPSQMSRQEVNKQRARTNNKRKGGGKI